MPTTLQQIVMSVNQIVRRMLPIHTTLTTNRLDDHCIRYSPWGTRIIQYAYHPDHIKIVMTIRANPMLVANPPCFYYADPNFPNNFLEETKARNPTN